MKERRDFKYEMEQLKAAYPEVDHIPEEVAQAAAQGMNLVEAYEMWKTGEKERAATMAQLRAEHAAMKAENERLKKELNVLKQNASANARTVGNGVQGGGAQARPNHAFLTGLESGGW